MPSPTEKGTHLDQARLDGIRHLAEVALESGRTQRGADAGYLTANRAPSGGFWQDLDPAEVLALIDLAEMGLRDG